ncbi:MAG: glycosyltransferase [Tuberibacillus sp.]
MISVICCTMRQECMENVFQNYERQTWADKELIVVLNNDGMNKREWEDRAQQSVNVTVFQLPEERTLGECLNFAIEKARHPYIAKFDDDDHYGPLYLKASMNDLITTGADLVGKRTVFMYFKSEHILAVHQPGREKRWTRQGMKGATLFFKKEIWEKVKFPELNRGEDTYFLRTCARTGYKMYGTDKKHFVCLRSEKTDHHTWNLNNQYLLRKCSIICETDGYTPYVR